MCQFGTLTLFSAVQYCIGLYHCKVDARNGGYALARSNVVEFVLEPHTEYVLFSDARSPTSVNASRLEWNADGAGVQPPASRRAWLDPWTLAVFREEATLFSNGASSLKLTSVELRHASEEAISYGLCPKAAEGSPWYSALLFFTLPLSRIRVQIWRKVTVAIVWPLVVYPLVAAYKRPLTGYIVLLDTLLVSDIFFWAGFGMAGLELADDGGFPESASIFTALAILTLMSLTLQWWYRSPTVLLVLAFASPLWSMFYWTPMALFWGVFRQHENYI